MTLEKNNVTTGKKYLITVCKNGPYLTSGAIPLSQKIIKYDSKWDSCEWQNISKKRHLCALSLRPIT
jgi:hypothetical protein